MTEGGRSNGRFVKSQVLVGCDAPSVEEIFSDSFAEPFSLNNFRQYAESRHCLEIVEAVIAMSYFEKNAWSFSVTDYQAAIFGFLRNFVVTDAPLELNLSEAQKLSVLSLADAELTEDRDFSQSRNPCLFDAIYQQTMHLVKKNLYLGFVNQATIQRQVRISREQALWFLQTPLPTVKEFFTFPDPINSAESRIHALCTATLIICIVLMDRLATNVFPFLYIPFTYGFLARVLAGPRLDPQAILVLFLFRPITKKLGIFEDRYVSGIPKRFAQCCCLAMAIAACVLRACEYSIPLIIVWALFFFLAVLAGIFDICVACTMFKTLMKLGLCPESWCQSCAVIYLSSEDLKGSNESLRYEKGSNSLSTLKAISVVT